MKKLGVPGMKISYAVDLQPYYCHAIMQLYQHKSFFNAKWKRRNPSWTLSRARVYMMHSTFPIGRGRVYSVCPEVNKLGDATTVVAVYDGADGFTSLIKFCGRVCHFSRHRRLVGDEPRRTLLFCGKYKLRRRRRRRRKVSFLKLCHGNDPLFSYTRFHFTQISDRSTFKTT